MLRCKIWSYSQRYRHQYLKILHERRSVRAALDGPGAEAENVAGESDAGAGFWLSWQRWGRKTFAAVARHELSEEGQVWLRRGFERDHQNGSIIGRPLFSSGHGAAETDAEVAISTWIDF